MHPESYSDADIAAQMASVLSLEEPDLAQITFAQQTAYGKLFSFSRDNADGTTTERHVELIDRAALNAKQSRTEDGKPV